MLVCRTGRVAGVSMVAAVGMLERFPVVVLPVLASQTIERFLSEVCQVCWPHTIAQRMPGLFGTICDRASPVRL